MIRNMLGYINILYALKYVKKYNSRVKEKYMKLLKKIFFININEKDIDENI